MSSYLILTQNVTQCAYENVVWAPSYFGQLIVRFWALLKTLGPKQTLGHSAVFRIVEVGSFAVSGYVRLF